MTNNADRIIMAIKATAEQLSIMYHGLIENKVPKQLAGNLTKVYLYVLLINDRRKSED